MLENKLKRLAKAEFSLGIIITLFSTEQSQLYSDRLNAREVLISTVFPVPIVVVSCT